MSAFFRGLKSSDDAGGNADRMGRLRVLVIGNSGEQRRAAKLQRQTAHGVSSEAPDSAVLRMFLDVSAGSGKTSLAHLLANGKPLPRTTTTVGCNTFVRVR